MNATAVRPTWALLLNDGAGAALLFGAAIALGQIRLTDAALADPTASVWFTISAALIAGAVAVRRVRPGLSLALAWASTLVHMAAVLDVAAAQLGLLVVLYSTARHGSTRVLRLAGLSAGIGALLAVGYLLVIDSWSTQVFPLVFGSSSLAQLAAFAALTAAALAVPWLLGLLVRTLLRDRESRRQRAAAELDAQRAQQIAELERARTELARDVHDIVGHSLAVIIAQAESLRFLEKADAEAPPSAAETVTATIADTARRSLVEVRRVLERTAVLDDRPAVEQPDAAALPDLDQLISDVAAARPTLASPVTGESRPLDEQRAVVAYRVAQELLTNALKHGDPAGELSITRTWRSDALEIVVTNAVRHGADSATASPAATGHGLAGVRHRLAEIGGRLDVESAADAFRARSSIPLPATEENHRS